MYICSLNTSSHFHPKPALNSDRHFITTFFYYQTRILRLMIPSSALPKENFMEFRRKGIKSSNQIKLVFAVKINKSKRSKLHRK